MAAVFTPARWQISAWVASRYPFSPNTCSAASRILPRVSSPSFRIRTGKTHFAQPFNSSKKLNSTHEHDPMSRKFPPATTLFAAKNMPKYTGLLAPVSLQNWPDQVLNAQNLQEERCADCANTHTEPPSFCPLCTGQRVLPYRPGQPWLCKGRHPLRPFV